MIPKIIHYCWFGKKQIPNEYEKYMDSWKKYCPDYNIIQWNENNFDVSINTYCYEAYKAKKWAFVSDYARLKILFIHGGIYLDTDVELLKPLDPLLKNNKAWIGFQNTEQINTGLGFGSEPYNPCIEEMLKLYEKIHFIKPDKNFDLTPCPVINTVALKKCGLKTGKNNCNHIQYLPDITVYPICFFNPINFDTKKSNISNQTYSIHHYSASWIGQKQKRIQKIKGIIPNYILNYRTILRSRRSVLKLENQLERLKQLKE